MGLNVMIFIYSVLSFIPAFSLSSFTLIKGLFSSSSLSAFRAVPSAYLRLLIFPLAILIPVCESSSLAFRMMYFTAKLNKQGDNIQPCHIPFPILNQSAVPCPVLTVAFFKLLIYFNWRLITLQYCDDFCHMLTWISYGSTCVLPSQTPIPSLWVIPVHRLWVPCFMHQTWTGQLFHDGNIHVSMLVSQIIPPLPSPKESKSLFFISVSLLPSCTQVIVTIFLNSIYMCCCCC